MSKYCGKRTLCPVGEGHAEACARAERETWGNSAEHQAARAAWREHSGACKAPKKSANRDLEMVGEGRGNPKMVAEVERRAKRDAGDVSVMTDGERLHMMPAHRGVTP